MFNPFVRNGTAGCLAPFVLGFAVSQESLSPCVIIIFDKSRPVLREVNFALDVSFFPVPPKTRSRAETAICTVRCGVSSVL